MQARWSPWQPADLWLKQGIQEYDSKVSLVSKVSFKLERCIQEIAWSELYRTLSFSRARRNKWCTRPWAGIELHRVSPRVRSYIKRLYDYVTTTVSLFWWAHLHARGSTTLILSCSCGRFQRSQIFSLVFFVGPINFKKNNSIVPICSWVAVSHPHVHLPPACARAHAPQLSTIGTDTTPHLCCLHHALRC